MKLVTQALTAWNIFAPVVSLGAMLFVDLSPTVGWDNVDENVAMPFILLALAWILGTPVTAGLALLFNRWGGEREVKWINISLLLFWAVAGPLVFLRTFI